MNTGENGLLKQPVEEMGKNNFFQKEVLSFDEARFYLDSINGVSSSYLYKLTSARKIPHYCPTGKLIFFKRSELDAWVFKNRRKPIDEIESEAGSYLKVSIK
jgi:excisionase family DNA binding protein